MSIFNTLHPLSCLFPRCDIVVKLFNALNVKDEELRSPLLSGPADMTDKMGCPLVNLGEVKEKILFHKR